MISSQYCKVLLFLFFLNSARGLQVCSPTVPIKSCGCIELLGTIVVSCFEGNDNELNTTLVGLEGQRVFNLFIKDSSLQYIPAEPLKHIKVTNIFLGDTKIRYLFDKPLEGDITKSLKSVEIRNSVFSVGLDWSTFEGVTSLREVTVADTDLQGVFENIKFLGPEVETLTLTDDKLEYIHPTAFSGLTGLRNLLLSGNRLKDFTRSMLPYPTSNINILDLTDNQLTNLSEDIFDGMPNLQVLILRLNKFTTLQAEYIQKVWNQLWFFDARENPLECSCDLSFLGTSRRPKRLFGSCIETKTGITKELKDLDRQYFLRC